MACVLKQKEAQATGNCHLPFDRLRLRIGDAKESQITAPRLEVALECGELGHMAKDCPTVAKRGGAY